jgi:phage-related baseplate assembly protein
MSRFPATAIDLSLLPPPQAIDALDYETILAVMKTDALARLAAVGIVLDTLVLESEPITVILETCAYRELQLRALVNNKAQALLLAFATGADLDHIGALFGVLRMSVLDANGNEVDETDDRFRARIQLAPDAFSNAGTLRGYIFHALSASLEVKDVHAFTPAAGRVDVVVLGYGDGTISANGMQAIYQRLTGDDVKPLTDDVRLSLATVAPYTITATLRVRRGPDPSVIQAIATAAVQNYADAVFLVDEEAYLSGIIAALQVPNVYEVVLSAPTANVNPGDYAAPRAAPIAITVEVVEGGLVVGTTTPTFANNAIDIDAGLA